MHTADNTTAIEAPGEIKCWTELLYITCAMRGVLCSVKFSIII